MYQARSKIKNPDLSESWISKPDMLQKSACHLFSAVPALQAEQQVGKVQLQGQIGRAVAHSLVVIVQCTAILMSGDQGIANLSCKVAIFGLLLQRCFQSLQ